MSDDAKVEQVLRLLTSIASSLQGINTNLRAISRRLEDPLPENVTRLADDFLTGKGRL
jgi:hypothetical protein